MLFTKTFLLTVLLMFSATNKENIKLQLEEKSVTGLDSEQIILNGQKVSFSNNGCVFLTDKIYCRVNKYDKKLNLVSSFGKKGKALGEFKAPSQITCNDKYIVIADFASSRVQVFNLNFKPLHVFFTDGPIFDLNFDRNGFLLIGIYTGRKDEALFQYTVTGEKNKTIKLKSTFGDPFKDIFKFSILPGGYVAITYLIQNVIEILDPAYNYYKTITIEGLPAKPKFKTLRDGLTIPLDNLVQSVASDLKSRIFVLASQYVEKPKQQIFVYGLDGKYLQTILLPQKTDEIFIDKENNLYAIQKNRTVLIKYKIRFS